VPEPDGGESRRPPAPWTLQTAPGTGAGGPGPVLRLFRPQFPLSNGDVCPAL